jgi:soluble lytic murein transglycosylase-like protein
VFSDTTRRCILIIVTAVILLSSAAHCTAAVFACKDSNGSIRFTNAPSTGNCNQVYAEQSFRNARPRPALQSLGSLGSSTFDNHIWELGSRYRVDPYLIKAVIRAESDFNSRAVSKKGAQGLMQLMPATARELRVSDPFNPRDNIDGGTRYLRQMLDIFEGNLMLSLAAYNAGPGTVRRAQGVPRIPETIRYVTKVLKQYRVYRDEGKG